MAKADRRAFDKIKNFGTVIGAKSTMTGDLQGEDSCVVHGRVDGSCKLEGSLVISPGGRWMGDASALNVLVAGEVVGDITAFNQIEILATGNVKGRLACRRIAIADGAVHQGELRMTPQGNVTRFSERRASPD